MLDPVLPEIHNDRLDEATVDAWRAGHLPGILVSTHLLKQLEEGEWIPHGWGFAWQDWYRDAVYVMPIPFNLIAGALRSIYYAMVRGAWFRQHEAAATMGYERGYAAGFRAGQKAAQAIVRGSFDGMVKWIREEIH